MMNWLLICYRPTTLFSLRMSHATSSGGKTLLVPTPYAFKMALIDSAFRCQGREQVNAIFEAIKGQTVRFQPPERCIVTNTFVKILRKREIKNKSKEPQVAAQEQADLVSHPYGQTIAYREFCYYAGNLTIAVSLRGLTEEQLTHIRTAAAHINYLGKRGSFMQYLCDTLTDALSGPFTVQPGVQDYNPGQYGVGHYLDDLGATDSNDLFERINTYGSKAVQLHKHRIFVHYLVPYIQVRASHTYTEYRRGDLIENRKGPLF